MEHWKWVRRGDEELSETLLTIHSTLTLLLPYIVSAINEKMMYIFAAVNVLSIPIGEWP